MEVKGIEPASRVGRAVEGVGLVRQCSSCGRSMSLDEGDILFGERWFHGVCWSLEAEAKE